MFRIKAFCSLSPAVGYSPDASVVSTHVMTGAVSFPWMFPCWNSVCIPAQHLVSLWEAIVCIIGCRLWARLCICICLCGPLTVSERSTCFWQQLPCVSHRLTQVLEGVKNQWIFTCEIPTNLAVSVSKTWTAAWQELYLTQLVKFHRNHILFVATDNITFPNVWFQVVLYYPDVRVNVLLKNFCLKTLQESAVFSIFT